MASKRDKKSSQSGKSAFVIMVGDEGAILLHMQNRQVVKRLFAQSPAKEHTRAMQDALNAAPHAPVTLLVDMMDQSYVKQTLPPVSSFNVGKIIRRRLNKDFSADDIKGYLIFGRDKKGRKDWNYLMVSLAHTPQLQQWLDFAVERSNPFRGICLVPLEVQSMVMALEKSQLEKIGKEALPTEWHMLVSHHKVGGFRQVVFRNGQIVFTRLAQMVGEPTPEVIAGNIEQEMLNTLEYLKRLGLQDIGTLTASIIASSEIKQVFDGKAIRKGQCHFYTPHEAATLLGMQEIAKPEDHFGDVVILGYIAQKRKLALSLATPYTQKIAKFVRYAAIAKIAAILACLGILTWGAFIGMDWLEANDSMEIIESNQRSLNSQLAELNDKKRTLPERINRYYDVANIYKSFYRPSQDVLYFSQRLFKALRDTATINSLRWTVSNAVVKAHEEDKRSINVEFESNIPTHPEREKLVATAQALVATIKAAFPDYDVSHSDLPGMLSEKEELKTVINESGDITSTESKPQSTTVRFMLKGPVNRPAPPPGAMAAGR